MSSDILFTLLYILLTICVIYPPIEFISAGLTIPTVFSSFLGLEEEQFIRYHIKRSSLTLFIYSLLPLGYILGLVVFAYDEEVIEIKYYKKLNWTSVIVFILGFVICFGRTVTFLDSIFNDKFDYSFISPVLY